MIELYIDGKRADIAQDSDIKNVETMTMNAINYLMNK